MEENELSWRIYMDARFPAQVSALLGELEMVSLTPDDAYLTAIKVRALAAVIGELEDEKRRAEIERAKHANR